MYYTTAQYVPVVKITSQFQKTPRQDITVWNDLSKSWGFCLFEAFVVWEGQNKTSFRIFVDDLDANK